MHLLTFVKIFHLVGLIMGLGGAILLDFTILTRGIIRPVSKFTIHQTELLSRIVSAGLVILWGTGAGLIWLNLADKPEYLTNQKLWAKMAIVMVLTLNGVVIHNRVLPFLKAQVGRRLFDDISIKQLALLTAIGTISFTSWVAPFVLGKASELNYVTPMATILFYYLAAVTIMWMSMFSVLSSLTTLQSVILRAAVKTLQPSEPWETMEAKNTQHVSMLRELSEVMQSALQQKPAQPQSTKGKARGSTKASEQSMAA
jgi:hypothetical protein